MTEKTVSPAQLEQRQQAPLKHGGAAARKALSTGEPFTGPAALAAQDVQDELATVGRASIVERNAIRLQAATDLYWAALVDAAERGDEKAYHSRLKTFGWLVTKAGALWAAHRQEQADISATIDYETIISSEDTQEPMDATRPPQAATIAQVTNERHHRMGAKPLWVLR